MKKLTLTAVAVFLAVWSYAQSPTYSTVKLTHDADQIRFEVPNENRYWFMSKTASDNKAFALYSPEDGGWFTYWKEASGDMIVNKGKVGIGTANPVSKLQVGLGTTNNPSEIAQFGSNNPNGEARVLSLVNYGGGADQSTSIDFHNKASWSPTGKIQVQQIGTNTQSKINFFTFNGSLQNRMTINHNGDVGIGTNAPVSFGTSQPTLELRGSSVHRTGAIRGYSSDLSRGWYLGRADDSSLPDGLIIATTDFTNINFRTASDTRMTIKSNGLIGIGTTNPDSKLTVNGGIHSQEIIVDIDAGTGPDYVFEEDYNLISLEETKAYIKVNKHLPEVPSAKVMESEGLELKDMSLLLLKKIEEMTLHQIELMEEVKALKAKVKELEK